MPVGCVIWESNFLPACWPLVTSHVTFSMPDTSISGIPNSAGPSPGTTKNLHLTTLFLCVNLTAHIPYFSMFKLLCVSNTTAFFVTHSSYVVHLGKWVWKFCSGIKFAIAPVSTLYTIKLHLVLDSNLVNWWNDGHYAIKVNIFCPYYIKALVLFSWFDYTQTILLANIMDCLPTLPVVLLQLCQFAYYLTVVLIPAPTTFLAMYRVLWGWLPCTTVFISVLFCAFWVWHGLAFAHSS